MIDTSPPPLPIKRRLKSIAPLQLGKILAVIYGVIGVLFIPFFLSLSAVSAHLPAGQRSGVMALGVGIALAMPLLYAVMGFVCGALGALIYNLVAKWMGGIEVEVE